MTIEHPIGDDVAQLAQRVEKARGRLAYQFDPALTEALSEDELHAERELAERIRGQERGQRWKQAQAAAAASDRARQTTEEIEKADIRDLLLARKAIAAQRRESSPHAKLASLYRHRSWSLRALAGVVGAGMLWSAVNVQHNIAPGGPSDPLYWFSYLLEGMISVCLIIIMIGTNKVAEWGVVDNRRQVAIAEIALLSLTVTLNTYPYLRGGLWYDAAVHAIAPVMIGVALLIHDAASGRFGLAISRATDQVRDLPDPAEQIRRTVAPSVATSYRMRVPPEVAVPPQNTPAAEFEAVPVQALEAAAAREAAQAEDDSAPKRSRNAENDSAAQTSERPPAPAKKAAPKSAPAKSAPVKRAQAKSESANTDEDETGPIAAVAKPPAAKKAPAAKPAAEKQPAQRSAPAKAVAAPKDYETRSTASDAKPAAPASEPAAARTEPVPATPPSRPAAPKAETRPAPASRPAESSPQPSRPAAPASRPAAAAPSRPAPQPEPARAAPGRIDASAAADIWTAKPVERPTPPPSKRQAAADAKRAAEAKKAEAKRNGTAGKGTDAQSGPGSDMYDTGQLRIAEILEQELAELQAARRRARTSRQRMSQQSGRDR